MSLSTYRLEYDRHLARLHRRLRRRCHRRAYASTSNTASRYNDEKSIHGFSLVPLWVWGSAWRLFGRRSSAVKIYSLQF